MLMQVTQAVDAVAATLEVDQLEALSVLDLDQVRRLLDTAYVGATSSVHADVVEAGASMCIVGLTSRLHFSTSRRERCMAGVLLAFAKHHDVDLKLRPYRQTEHLFGLVRDGRLGVVELRQWLRSRVVRGNAHQPLISTPSDGLRPLLGCSVTIARPVTEPTKGAISRDDFLARTLGPLLESMGATVQFPTQQLVGDARSAEGARALRRVIQNRWASTNVLVCFGDEASGGVGAEIKTAIDLGFTVIVVKKTKKVSPLYDNERVIVLPYGDKPQSGPGLVADYLTSNPWAWQNSARRRDDRELLRVRERTLLLRAWQSRTDPQRRAVAGIMRMHEDDIALNLQTAVGLETFGTSDLAQLRATLEVPAPGPVRSFRAFYTGELEALAVVASERTLSLSTALLACYDLQLELSMQGMHRGRIDEARWREFFDTIEQHPGETA